MSEDDARSTRQGPFPDALPASAAGDAMRALFAQSPFSTVLYDTGGRIIAVNASFERLFGLTKESIPAEYSILADAQLAAAGHLPAVQRAFHGDVVVLPPVYYDAATLDGAGRRSWTQGHFFPMRDHAGAVSGVVLVHVDLTERVEAQQRLEEQAAELETQTAQLQAQAADMEAQQAELHKQAADTRALLEGIADPFVVHDGEWRFRYLNGAAAGIFARSGVTDAEGLIGRVVWEVYPELVGTPLERQMRRARDEGAALTFADFHAPTGRWSEIRCYPIPGQGLATLWKDITEQRRAEEARHFVTRASELLASSLDTDETVRGVARLLVPRLADWCSILLLDADGTLRQVAVAHTDPAKVEWARTLAERYPADPDARTGAHEVVRTRQPVMLREIPDALLVTVAQDAEHLRILREIGFASVLTVPLVARGAVLGAMTLVTAESGRRYGDAELALAQELATRAALAIDHAALYRSAVRAREEAETANRAKSEFLTMMSHELRTPLNAIGGYAQLMELGLHGPITEEQGESLRRVQRSQQHLLSLINDVLNFAKLEAGRVTYRIERVAVAPLLAELDALVGPQLGAKALRFACAACDPALAVAADAEKTRQVMLNLLSNAIKFTEAGGEIRVAARADGDQVRIEVTDTGIGIPADRIDAVFEPFVQLAQGASPGRGGTGLGLSISRDLARAMGGELTLDSTVGRGSTFTLVLPRHPD